MTRFIKSVDYIPGPYDKCLKCAFLGNGCDGPRTNSMPLDRWWMWCRVLKEERGFTNEYLAEKSGVSLATIDRIMRGKASGDIQRFTTAAIESALIGSDAKYPCAMDTEIKLPELQQRLLDQEKEINILSEALNKVHENYKAELAAMREEYKLQMAEQRAEDQRKIDFLRGECEKKDKLLDKLIK